MKILMVTCSDASGLIYGVNRAIKQLALTIQHRGHTVVTINATEWEPNHQRAYQRFIKIGLMLCKLLRLSSEPILRLATCWVQATRTAQRVDGENFSHVWFHDPFSAFFFRLRHPNLATRKLCWGVFEHGLGSCSQTELQEGILINSRWMRLGLRMEAWCLNRAHFVFSSSYAALNLLTRDLGYTQPKSNWHALGFGCPMLTFSTRESARNLLGWSNSKFYVLVMGRTSIIKRIDIAIDACILAQDQIPGLQLVIVGGALASPMLIGKAKELHQAPICTVTDNPALYYSAVDVYLSACAVESFGLANLEALCAGIPLLLAAGGGGVEVIQSGG
jgi:glycosyltransferase involved in cell wall biosynthesis